MIRLFFLTALALQVTFQSAFAIPITVEISAGKFDRPAGTICSVNVEGKLANGASGVLISPGNGFGQLSSGVLYFITDEPLKAGQKKRYSVTAAKVDDRMTCSETDAEIELKQLNRSVLKFVKVPTPEAANHDPVFTRTGYIHPLFSPAGKEVTGDYPADHVHQHALFFAWTKTTFQGRNPEFWNQKIKAGRVNYVKTKGLDSGPLFAGFSVGNICEDLTAPGKPEPVLNETWTVRGWHTTGAFNLIDIEIEQQCATDSPLTIQKYHYGGMAIRGNDQWLNPDKKGVPPATFLTDEGKDRITGNHSKPQWVSLYGPLDGGSASVTVFPHPDNFRHPQHVRLHPSKPYFVFAPMVEESFQITPETPYRARFRYLVHDAVPAQKELETLCRNYTEAPLVTVVTDKP